MFFVFLRGLLQKDMVLNEQQILQYGQDMSSKQEMTEFQRSAECRGGQTFWWENRITGLCVIKGLHLLKSKEFSLNSNASVFFSRLPLAIQNNAVGYSLPIPVLIYSQFHDGNRNVVRSCLRYKLKK